MSGCPASSSIWFPLHSYELGIFIYFIIKNFTLTELWWIIHELSGKRHLTVHDESDVDIIQLIKH